MERRLTLSEMDARKVWRKYLFYKEGRYVIRSGFGLCGAYDIYRPGQRREAWAQETILEHQAAVATLAMWVHRKFPDVMPDLAYTRLLELLLNHDVVEVHSGDMADDGSLDKAEKAALEQQEMLKYAGEDDEHDRTTLYHDFLLLEAVTGRPFKGKPDGNQLLGQLAFELDKLEAILQLAQFESKGVKPTLTHKLTQFGSISTRDRFYMTLTGDDSSLDVWLAHMFDYCKTYHGFWAMRMIAEAAYEDVRGHLPKWEAKIFANTAARCWPEDRD